MKSSLNNSICRNLTHNRPGDNVLWLLLELKHSKPEECEEDEEFGDEEVEDGEDGEDEVEVHNRLRGLQLFSNLIVVPCLSSRKGSNQHLGDKHFPSQLKFRPSISTTQFQAHRLKAEREVDMPISLVILIQTKVSENKWRMTFPPYLIYF